jgi:hypothetical protein
MPSDGLQPESKAFDYYASFAIHYYSLLLARSLEKDSPKTAQRHRDRAASNSLAIVNLFAPDGQAIPFGRSMTYRFATSAFWAACAFDGVKVPSPQLRELITASCSLESRCDQGLVAPEYQIFH